MRKFIHALVLLATGAATTAALFAWRQPSQSTVTPAIVTAKRTAPEPPTASPAPPVPVGLADYQPAKFVFESPAATSSRGPRSTYTVTRSRDRVRLVMDEGRREWLFVQNANYPGRAMGYLTDHEKREIQVFEESALRSALGIRGWADVVTLRFVESGQTRKAARQTLDVDMQLLADPVERFQAYARLDPADAHDH